MNVVTSTCVQKYIMACRTEEITLSYQKLHKIAVADKARLRKSKRNKEQKDKLETSLSTILLQDEHGLSPLTILLLVPIITGPITDLKKFIKIHKWNEEIM
ncbi:hypothetical protein HPP92_014832 [Vanilla planifolia]|uniref:Uncharacterized protein n=1 Tax=Vanilla planifolia TaxID=51239 RepID=A0A835UUH4_VANPL|nr:hypothetical protein HPP92_014832 [Vanilla planifolia]